MLPNSVSGSGGTNQWVRGGQNPGAGPAGVLHAWGRGCLQIKEVVMTAHGVVV